MKWYWTVGSNCGSSDFVKENGGNITIQHNGIGFRYNSLIDFYKTGRVTIVGYYECGTNPARWINENLRPALVPTNIIMPQAWRDVFVWEILGRIAHLIGDMAVPAHAHNDPHVPIVLDSDMYEDFMEEHYDDTWYELPFLEPVGWNANYAYLVQGDFLNVYNNVQSIDYTRILRYLFYTTNQIADRFPSNDYNGDANYSTNFNGDDYSVLNIIQQINHPFIAGSITPFEINKYAFLFAMRAIAGLYYWFTMETDLLQNTLVQNSFGGGNVRVNSTIYSNGYRIPAWNPQTSTLEAVDQVFNGRTLLFQNWQKIVNSSVVHTFYSRSITISPEANTTYKAIFIQEPIVAPVISSFTQSPNPIYKGQSGTVKCNLSQGNGNITYSWSSANFPSGVSISYWENTAYITYNYKTSDLPTNHDEAIKAPMSSLTCTASNAVGSYTLTTVVYLLTSGGGCPFVYTWNGNEYVEDNNILPQSMSTPPDAGLVTDHYQLFQEPIETEGKYKLRVAEFEQEVSILDQFKLLIIDHIPEALVSVNDVGEINLFAKPASFVNASMNDEDVYKLDMSWMVIMWKQNPTKICS